MARFHGLFPMLLLLPLACVGCSYQDPVDRPGTWQPSGSNEQNLRAMVTSPRDLDRGVAATTSRGNQGSIAATRLFIERRRPLITQSTSEVGASQQQSADPPLPGLGGPGTGASRGAR
jgi:hypothetical protein